MSETRAPLTVQQLLDCLEVDWKDFPGRFANLPAENKKAYLQRQGYASLHDLLAHVTAWWQECLMIVQSILDAQELPKKEYDFDIFNAAAVQRYHAWTDADLLVHFENLRRALICLVADLPEDSLHNQRINNWLGGCVVEHYEDHGIK